MKSLTIKRYIDKEVNLRIQPSRRLSPLVTGYLFLHGGLKLLVYKEFSNANSWHVLEYFTGRGISMRWAATRKNAITEIVAQLEEQGSMLLCKVLLEAINDTGIVNN